ncbi:MAG: DUF454 family protein, partial [Pseudomonadota bacterium]
TIGTGSSSANPSKPLKSARRNSPAGKSTLLALLLKTAKAQTGEITWDGTSLDLMNTDDLYGAIGVLTQTPRLFSTSIRDNLLLGKPDATDAELLAACDAVDLASFIHDLPQGLDTWLGEAGTKVSGGQARRLTLARLLLKDPALILLDEPTEGLDPATERHVIETISKAFHGRTVLIITHRLAPLEACDRVILLDRGHLTKDMTAQAFLTGEKERLADALQQPTTSQASVPAARLHITTPSASEMVGQAAPGEAVQAGEAATTPGAPIASTSEQASEQVFEGPVEQSATIESGRHTAQWFMRPFYFTVGMVSLILGLIGVVVPGLPTTIFMIIALWAFARSSRRFHDWLWQHPRFGPPLVAWSQHRVVPRTAKWAATLMMLASLGIMFAVGVHGIAIASTAIICAAVLCYVLPKPEQAPDGTDTPDRL